MIPSAKLFRLLSPVALLLCLSAPARLSAETIRVGGTGGGMRTMQIMIEAFKKSRPDSDLIIIPGLGSRGGKRALLAGAIDIAVSADPLRDEETSQGALGFAYGRTPFVFATSKKTTAQGLTLQEVIQIYDGKKDKWPDRSRLRLILRPEGDSDNNVLRSISPAMAEAVKNALSRSGMMMAVTDQDSADAIETVFGGLGTSTLALILSEKRPIKPVAIDGVVPGVAAIANGLYPYFKILYLITMPKASKRAQEFMAFVRSPAGRLILGELGHWVPEPKAKQ